MLSTKNHSADSVKSPSSLGRFQERIPIPYLEFDTKARILRSNSECLRMLNGGGALSGRSLFGFLAGVDIRRLRDHLTIVRQTDKPQHVHLSIVHNGSSHPIELWTRRQLLGGQIRFLAVMESPARAAPDFVTLPAQERLPSADDLMVNLSNAATLKSVADTFGNYCRESFTSPAGMVFVERGGELELISHWYSGRPSKKSIDDLSIRKGPVARAFRAREPIFLPRQRMTASNVARYLGRLASHSGFSGIVFFPIISPPRRPVGVLTMVLSNTDKPVPALLDHLRALGRVIAGSFVRARAFDEAVAGRIAIEKDIRRREEFLSVLSHELKNSMMPILGWAVALGSGTLPAEKQNIALDGIVRNVRSLNYLVDDIFDAARISSGKLRLQRARMRIQEVAREALTAVQASAEKKKLRMSTDISEAIPPFFADSNRLRQVLINLLNNAVKFTPEGGRIALKILRRGDAVQFSITDSGKGIAPKFLPFVFDRFQQDYRSSKPRDAGLGLGLAIVREIVGLHGGWIRAYSDGADKGSTFVVRMPMHTRHG
jgi:signal transduction histidine kinase